MWQVGTCESIAVRKEVRMEASRGIESRFVGLAAVSGAAGGVAMAMWMMIYSAATNNGFWTPLNVCMASFIYRSDAEMMIKEEMAHPGMMSMNAALVPSHLAVGFLLHMTFSVVVGVSFALVLLAAIRVLRLPLLATRLGYTAAATIGALILYALMMYVILPVANPLMVDMTPRGAFIIGHVLYGLTFGLIAFALLRPSITAPSLRQAAA
jgi:uncharacterized membrane protein YagU involved in acid resistance